MSNPRPPHTPPPKRVKRANFNLHGATPTRAGDNYVSSTNLGHTQQEIKSSLWGRILRNEPKLVENLIKPHLVDNDLVAAIEQVIGEDTELKAARDLLFENAVPEKEMYTPMVTLLRHISTFGIQPSGDAPLLNNPPASTPKVDSTPSVPTMPTISLDTAGSSVGAPLPDTEQRHALADDCLSFPNDGEDHGLYINRTWVDTHASLLHTDGGLYVSVRGIKGADNPDGKRSRDDSFPETRSKVARADLQVDAATAAHTASALYESQDDLSDDTTTPDVDYVPIEEEHEDEILEEAVMDDRKPDISLIDLPPSEAVSPAYLWRQCAVFLEMKKSASDGPLGCDVRNARLPEGTCVATPKSQACKSIITQMADNARILMATRPFLCFCLHITFCGTNFNLALFDRNGAIISRTYDFEMHLRLFIRVIRRLTCEMTAYDLGLDTTVRPEGCLGSVGYPTYLVKVSEKAWYKTEGVPIWPSTSLIGRGTLVFNARGHGEPNGPLRILKNAWREDGRLKESELYDLIQKSEAPFTSPKALAKFVVGGDVPLHDGKAVTIECHRANFGSKVIGNGATLHRLVLASRGNSLASYQSINQLLFAALGIVIAHKHLHDQGILHGDISYGNTFLSEYDENNDVHGFLADLDLASISDKALDKVPEEIAKTLKEQREKGPRSGTVIFMAIELLHLQVQHFNDEKAARKRGRLAPPTLRTERETYHDLEALIWVLVYAMMIHNYDSLTNQTDRKEYKAILDNYFGHGSASTTFIKRHAMWSLAHSDVGLDHVSKWFSDPDERKFFISCMSLVAEHHKPEKNVVNWKKPIEGEIDDANPVFWRRINFKMNKKAAEDANNKSMLGKVTKAVQEPVVRSRTRPPVITYDSVVSLLMNAVDEFE